MKALLWSIGFGVALTVAGIVYLLHYGYRQPPVKILKPTVFERPEEIGALLVRRFWPDLRDEKIVVLGQSPFLRSGYSIWEGFMRTALAEGIRFDHYFKVRGLPVLTSDVKFEEYSLSKVHEALKNGRRVFVHHVATDSVVKELATEISRGLVLFQAEMPIKKEDEGRLMAKCTDENSEFQLGCASVRTARPYYRKNLSPDHLIAVVEKYVPLKQVLFVHEPDAAGE